MRLVVDEASLFAFYRRVGDYRTTARHFRVALADCVDIVTRLIAAEATGEDAAVRERQARRAWERLNAPKPSPSPR